MQFRWHFFLLIDILVNFKALKLVWLNSFDTNQPQPY